MKMTAASEMLPKEPSDAGEKNPLCPRHRGISTYTIQYFLKRFRLTPIDLCYFRNRLCYFFRIPLLPIRHQIAQEIILKLHSIEIPKALVDFHPFRDSSFSQNIGKLMQKLTLLRRGGFDPSIDIHQQGSLFLIPNHSFHRVIFFLENISWLYFLLHYSTHVG